ncbi:hypothetical protein F5878DRAFT_672814 [Lentinula raphanica]|uniref:Uncharacterized protein n=1 Tax=Lentinula raphanica TaxID=153919 RepID=A0AA38PL99_9AGAR|nr:hypothetical protein F5878DRAFT_672814 [Lentinula raphanica]
MFSDSDRLRVAIALTALKYKQPNQSCYSYVLELRNKFASSIPRAPTTDGSWKTHALNLENELKLLKERREIEETEFLIRVNEAAATLAACHTDDRETNERDISEAPGASDKVKNATKKSGKQKKNAAVDASKSNLQNSAGPKSDNSASLPRQTTLKLDLRTILQEHQGKDSVAFQRADTISSSICSLAKDDSLFISLSNFDRLACALSTRALPLPTTQKILLISSTIRALDCIAHTLDGAISASPSARSNIQATKTVQLVNQLLEYLLSTCFEMVFLRARSTVEEKKVGKKNGNQDQNPSRDTTTKSPSIDELSPEFWSSFERLLGVLSTAILEPIIKFLVVLSQQSLSYIFGVHQQGPSSTSPSNSHNLQDIRADLLSLFQNVFAQISRLTGFKSSDLSSSTQGYSLASGSCSDSRSADMTSGVREYLSLAAVRELFKLFAIEYSPRGNNIKQTQGPTKPKPNARSLRPRSKEERIRKLARKDAVWYLCTVLHVLFEDACFPLNEEPGPEASSTRLNQPSGAGDPNSASRSKASQADTSAARVTSKLTSISLPPANNPSYAQTVHADSTSSKAKQCSSTIEKVSTTAVDPNEAARASSSLLREGLSESFHALLCLVATSRPSSLFSRSLEDVIQPRPPASAIPPSAKATNGVSDIGVSGDDTFHAVKDKEQKALRYSMLMNEVEYNMVLGIIERYWECTLGLPSTTGWT